MKGVLQIALAAMLMGSVPLIVKFSSMDSYSLALGRIILATAAIIAYIAATRQKLDRIHSKASLFIFGLLHALIIVLFFISVKMIPTGTAVLLLFAGNIYLVPLSAAVLKEKISKATIIATTIAAAGLLALCPLETGALNWGYAAGLLSGVFMALVFLQGKILSKRYNQISLTFYQNYAALPIVSPLAFAGSFELSLTNIIVLISLGIFCTTIAFLLLFKGMKTVKGQAIGMIMLMELVVPIAGAIMLFNEIPSAREIIGASLIITSCMIIISRS